MNCGRLPANNIRVDAMKLPRRTFLSLALAAGAVPAAFRLASSQTPPKPALEKRTRPLAERLADYADRLRYDDLDAATIERIKALVIDTLGCGIAAFDERPVQICRDVALAPGGGVSSVIGSLKRTTPDLASFANGAAVRYYDLNDVYVGRFAGHPSDNIAPCLAVAEAERASAEELITAIALVYEVNGNELTLVAVEYIIPQPLWKSSEPPRLFGHSFTRNNTLGIWALHAWIWRHNPLGMFADFNPNVDLCGDN